MKKILVFNFLILLSNIISAQWKMSTYSFNPDVLTGISFGGDSTVGVLDQKGQLFISNNNGKDFELKNSSFFNKKVQIINDSNYVLVQTVLPFFTNGYATYQQSNDFGNTWETKYFISDDGDTLNSSRIANLFFWDNGKAVAVTLNENDDSISFVYTSLNYGNTWIKLNTLGFNFENFSSDVDDRLQVINFNDMLIFRHLSNRKKIIILSDYGNSISEIEVSQTTNINGIAFKDSLNGLIYIGTNVLKTIDGGVNFTIVNAPFLYSPNLAYAKPTLNLPLGFYVAAGNNGVFASYDDGESWELIDNNKYLYTNFRDAGLGIAYFQDFALMGSYELYYTNKLNLSVPIFSIGKNHIKTYPNPSNGSFAIELEESASIQIYSTIGTLVYNGNLDQGVQNISLPNLAKGVYILKAEGTNFQQSLRVVIE